MSGNCGFAYTSEKRFSDQPSTALWVRTLSLVPLCIYLVISKLLPFTWNKTAPDVTSHLPSMKTDCKSKDLRSSTFAKAESSLKSISVAKAGFLLVSFIF